MADHQLATQSKPTAPSAGNGIIWVDSTAPVLSWIDSTGRTRGRSTNISTSSQGAGFATDTYLAGSQLLIPSYGMQVGTKFLWLVSASKSAASTATPVYTVRFGANQSTADTSRLALTGPAQTAATDVALLTVIVVVRSVSATGVIQGTVSWDHQSATAGFANNGNGAVEATSSAFDNTALNGQYIGLSINGGASAAWTVTQVQTEADW